MRVLNGFQSQSRSSLTLLPENNSKIALAFVNSLETHPIRQGCRTRMLSLFAFCCLTFGYIALCKLETKTKRIYVSTSAKKTLMILFLRVGAAEKVQQALNETSNSLESSVVRKYNLA